MPTYEVRLRENDGVKEFPFGGWNLSHGPRGIVGTGGAEFVR